MFAWQLPWSSSIIVAADGLVAIAKAVVTTLMRLPSEPEHIGPGRCPCPDEKTYDSCELHVVLKHCNFTSGGLVGSIRDCVANQQKLLSVDGCVQHCSISSADWRYRCLAPSHQCVLTTLWHLTLYFTTPMLLWIEWKRRAKVTICWQIWTSDCCVRNTVCS